METKFLNWVPILIPTFATILLPFIWYALWLKRKKHEMQLNETAKRKEYQFEVAKEAIALFGEIKDAFWRIRSPHGGGSETEEIKKAHPSVFEVKKSESLGGFQINRPTPIPPEVVIDFRISIFDQLFTDIRKLQPKFLSVFGTEEPFKRLWGIRDDVRHYSYVINHAGDSDEEREQLKKGLGIVYGAGDDLILPVINEIVEQVNNLCAPILRGTERRQERQS